MGGDTFLVAKSVIFRVGIREMFSNLEGKIILEWIPSHVDIAGNEKADTLAKESLTLKITSNIPVALPNCQR